MIRTLMGIQWYTALNNFQDFLTSVVIHFCNKVNINVDVNMSANKLM